MTWTTANAGTGRRAARLDRDGDAWCRATAAPSSAPSRRPARLPPGRRIARRIDYALPISLSGAYQVVVTVDTGNTVAETASRGGQQHRHPRRCRSRWRPMPTWRSATSPAPAAHHRRPGDRRRRLDRHQRRHRRAASPTPGPTRSSPRPMRVPGNGDDIVLGSFVHTRRAGARARPTRRARRITLPPGFNGRYHLFVQHQRRRRRCSRTAAPPTTRRSRARRSTWCHIPMPTTS